MTAPTNVTFTTGTTITSEWLNGVNDYVNDQTASQIPYTPPFTGSVVTTVQDKLAESVSVKDFGAVGDGVTNDKNAFLAACAASDFVDVPAGTYNIAGASTVTISSILNIQAGAILKPASGVHLNLAKAPVAGLYQVFDRSAGGVVQFIGAGNPTVYVEWWGATSGAGGRTDNEIPIQYAIDSVQSIVYGDFTTIAPNNDNNGGVVRLGYQQEYLVSSYIHIRNRTRLEGQNGNFCVLKANAATWSGQNTMVLFQNNTSSQFWCRLDSLTVNANNVNAITQVIYAPAWQESCGLRDVLIREFKGHGVYIDNGYGGSVGANLSSVQFFPSSTANSNRHCIHVDVPYLSGVYNLLLKEVSLAGGSVTVAGNGSTGIYAKGRVRIQANGVHVEGIDYGIILDTNASLYGLVGATGNPSVIELVSCSSTWTGEIDCPTMNMGGAQYLVKSYTTPNSKIYEIPPVFKRVVYPSTPSEILAYARNTSASGTLESNAYGFSSLVKTATGQYTLTFDTTKFKPNGGTSYKINVDIADFAGGGKSYYVNGQTATQILLVFKNTSGSNADCDNFTVSVYALGL